MPDFPLHSGGITVAVSTAFSVAAVASATPNVKGAYTEIVASTAHDADAVLLVISQSNTAAISHLIDFAVGAAGSEVVVWPNWLLAGGVRMTTYAVLPCSIPAGSRISARCQATTASAQVQVRALTLRGGLWAPASGGTVVALGADTSDSGGQVIDPGATLNTYGAWSQLSASTAADIVAVRLSLGMRTNAAPAQTALNYYVDLGVGGAGAEVAIVDGLPFTSSTDGSFGAGGPHIWLPCSIPAGSRIAARAKANTTDATDRLFDVVVHALTV